jgi:2-(1,2-epoxy-1,2-dihydrophenyl)acetyl-CoA isomerase
VSYETLLYRRDGHVATVTLNRPDKLNAMSWRMFVEIGEAFEQAAADPEVRCVVLAGAGRGFCSGADLTDPDNASVVSAFDMKDRMRKVDEVAQRFLTCPVPTIARVHGIAAGAGCNLALGCDLVVASTEASFAELFVRRGLVVDFGGTFVLSRLLPLNRAKEIALLGDTLSAHDAERLGLLNRLCEPDELDDVVADLAARLIALPPRTVALIKDNLNRSYERSLEQNLEAEAISQALAATSADTLEAIQAWVQKREPRFTGR